MCKIVYRHLATAVAKAMIEQLEANKHKGDRPNWVNLNSNDLLKEIYYHTGKLQQALKDNNKDLIKEYCADIANLSGMIMDVEKVIDIDKIDPIESRQKANRAEWNGS